MSSHLPVHLHGISTQVHGMCATFVCISPMPIKWCQRDVQFNKEAGICPHFTTLTTFLTGMHSTRLSRLKVLSIPQNHPAKSASNLVCLTTNIGSDVLRQSTLSARLLDSKVNSTISPQERHEDELGIWHCPRPRWGCWTSGCISSGHVPCTCHTAPRSHACTAWATGSMLQPSPEQRHVPCWFAGSCMYTT